MICFIPWFLFTIALLIPALLRLAIAFDRYIDISYPYTWYHLSFHVIRTKRCELSLLKFCFIKFIIVWSARIHSPQEVDIFTTLYYINDADCTTFGPVINIDYFLQFLFYFGNEIQYRLTIICTIPASIRSKLFSRTAKNP